MRRNAFLLALGSLGLGCLVLIAPQSSARPAAYPALRVVTQVGGLSQPWDVKPLPKGRLLITERETRRLILWRAGHKRVIRFPSANVWASGETGLMGLAVDPSFAKNRRLYTCQGGFTGGGHDVRVVAWRMNPYYTAVRRLRTVVAGMPASSGRHGGCRLLIPRSGALLIGTGDAAVGTNAQDRGSLGGKVLRVNRFTGAPWPSNPFVHSANAHARLILTYGHRNVQGLAQRSDGTLWSVEHGPDRDDEVNRLVAGGNYGWNPVPGYNESVPMTDQSLPGRQVEARWSSGYPTLATSGASWVGPEARWGSFRGMLAVAALKAGRVSFLRFDSAGRFLRMRTPSELTQFGRLRSVTRLANGDLLVTTANGSDDRVLRVSPR